LYINILKVSIFNFLFNFLALKQILFLSYYFVLQNDPIKELVNRMMMIINSVRNQVVYLFIV